ncbi:MAG: hypothetical protein JNG85_05810 [Spirochaetaceae bacterium]|nr:hypothetical protein [Spirochaetaceae bacterium]
MNFDSIRVDGTLFSAELLGSRLRRAADVLFYMAGFVPLGARKSQHPDMDGMMAGITSMDCRGGDHE